jgi:plasmid rolling circle replication initiator protein Rep
MNQLSLSRNTSDSLKTNGKPAFTPSLDTVQQVDINEREFRRASQSKSERWTLRTPTKRDIVDRLGRVSAEDALRLKNCCSAFRVLTCGEHTLRSYPTFRCKKLFCPDCAAERATRLGNQTEAKIREVMKTTKGRLCFLTLTTKNAATLGGGLSKLKKSFANFKRKKDFKNHIKGYFGAFEYTFNPKTNDFHVHLHLIVLRGKFWNQSDISDAWRDVTGDSFIVDIREIKNTHKGVKEVCKYPMKPTDLMEMPDDKFLEVVKMKKGTRMFVSGGCFYNVKLDDDDAADDNVFSQFAELTEGDACPFCKQELFDVLVDRGQHIGLHKLNAMPATVPKTNSS